MAEHALEECKNLNHFFEEVVANRELGYSLASNREKIDIRFYDEVNELESLNHKYIDPSWQIATTLELVYANPQISENELVLRLEKMCTSQNWFIPKSDARRRAEAAGS